MKKNYVVSKEIRERNIIKAMYQEMIDQNADYEILKNRVDFLIKTQKEDGSWSVIDDYKVDSDIQVEYVFIPTYYATAALIGADLKMDFNKDSVEKKALLKGLEFASRRKLVGHGFDATKSLIQTLAIYKQAGVYKWLQENEAIAIEFCDIITEHICNFRMAIVTGRTISDWNRDFRKEFEQEIADYDAWVNPYVWYAAYGSNINSERFMKYINRCTDNTEPKEDRPYMIPYELYFASSVNNWDNKGVAFINDNKAGITWGRVYKITLEQFKEIQMMEGSKYSKKIELGKIDDIPVFTFTSPFERADLNEACNRYLETIKNGLKEAYPDKTELVLDIYLYAKNLSATDIEIISFLRNSAHGVKLGEIHVGDISLTELKQSIQRLYYYGFIVQDRRSVRRGNDPLDIEAVVYTSRDKRELCDILSVCK